MLGNHINPVFRVGRKQNSLSAGVASGDGGRVASADAPAQSVAVFASKKRLSFASTPIFCFQNPQSNAPSRFFSSPSVPSNASTEVFWLKKMRSNTSSRLFCFPKVRSNASRPLFCSPKPRSNVASSVWGVRKLGPVTAGRHFYTPLLNPSTKLPAAHASGRRPVTPTVGEKAQKRGPKLFSTLNR